MISIGQLIHFQKNFPEEYRKFFEFAEKTNKQSKEFDQFIGQIQNSPALGVLFSNAESFKKCFNKYKKTVRKVVKDRHPANVSFLNMNTSILLFLLKNHEISLSDTKNYKHHIQDEDFWRSIIAQQLVDEKEIVKTLNQHLSNASSFLTMFNNKALSMYILSSTAFNDVKLRLTKKFLETYAQVLNDSFFPKAIEDVRSEETSENSVSIENCYKMLGFVDSEELFAAIDKYSTTYRNKFSEQSNPVRRMLESIMFDEYAMHSNDYVFFLKHLDYLRLINKRQKLFQFSNRETMKKLLEKKFINKENISIILKQPPHLTSADVTIYKKIIEDEELLNTLIAKKLIDANKFLAVCCYEPWLLSEVFRRVNVPKVLYDLTNELSDEVLSTSDEYLSTLSALSETHKQSISEERLTIRIHQYLNSFNLDQETSKNFREALNERKIRILRSIVENNIESLYSFSALNSFFDKEEKKMKIKLNI